MIKSPKHHRFHIPNSLAIFAALLLVASSVVGFEANQDAYSSGQEKGHSLQTEKAETESIGDAVKSKPRGINLGSLLFRRG